MKIFRSFSFILLFLLGTIFFTASVKAQTTTINSTEKPLAISGLTQCFDYYKQGSVFVDVKPSVETVVAGSPITFTGKIQNDNAYPVVNGQVYVKILQNKNIVDEFIAEENLSIEGKKSKDITIVWKVPAHIPSGEYQLATNFIVDQKFNLSGFSFADAVAGPTATFSVSGYSKDIPYLDRNSITVNDEPYSPALPLTVVEKGKEVVIKGSLVNNSKEDVIVPVTWTLYAWDAQKKENKITEEKIDYVVSAEKKQPIEYAVFDIKHPVYLVVAKASYKDTSSILHVRLGLNGVPGTRLNFPSTATYPLVKGEEATVFSCFNSTMTDVVTGGKLVLTTEDLLGNILHSYTYKGDVTGEMMAVRDVFTPTKTRNSFIVRAKLYKGDTLVDESFMKYCKNGEEFGVCSQTSNKLIGGGAILLLIVALLSVYFLKKKK
jgi:hypothetical protein